MTTKEQERQAIEEIRKIVEGLGENSYVGFAMEGVLELAEDNIREDTAYSMKKNAEIAWERADKAEKESKLLNAELGTAKKITEENNKVIAKQIRWPMQALPGKMFRNSQRITKRRKRNETDTQK